MALTGYEKSLTQYTKSELVQIARTYSVYYRTESGVGKIGVYDRLTKQQLIDIIQKDKDYQKAGSQSRIQLLKRKLSNVSDPEEIMINILEVFKDVEIIPTPGNYYTFVYKAKTVKDRSKQYSGMPTEEVYYDQHPLVAVSEIKKWGFIGLNFHWGTMRNYTWQEVLGQLHIIRRNEIDYLRSLNYMKLIRYRTK